MAVFLIGIFGVLALLIYSLRHRQNSRTHIILALGGIVLIWLGILQMLMEKQPNQLLATMRRLGVEVNPFEALLHQLAVGSFDKVLKQVEGNPLMMSQLITWLMALVLIVVGLVVWFSARHRATRNANSGVLLAGLGMVLVVVPMMTRTTADLLKPTPEMSAQVATEAPIVFATNTPALIAFAQDVVLKPTHEELVVTLLPTRFVYATPTVAVVAMTENPHCSGTTQNNLNLREGPATTFNVLVTIPYSSVINLYGKNDDGSWLWANFQDKSGWVSADYIVPDPACPSLPIHSG